MANIPHAVLSEKLNECLNGYKVISGLFTTFAFEPDFFEQEIIPLLFDLKWSNDPVVKLAQLEEALRDVPGEIEVYYDPKALGTYGKTSAKLDIKRIPVRHKTGCFHPKNIILLIEEIEPATDENPKRKLLFGNMSANLTRAGWWENIEASHFEILDEYDANRVKDDLRRYLLRLKRISEIQGESRAIEDILMFLRSNDARGTRTKEGFLLPHFYSGDDDFISFLRAVGGNKLDNMYLEILSPYLDRTYEKSALKALIDEFNPKKVLIYLPIDKNGIAQCTDKYHESTAKDEKIRWGTMPVDFSKIGKGDNAIERKLHAKVYRFFSQNPKNEYVFVGSVNLTDKAHTRKNFETGMFLEVETAERPDFWLRELNKKVESFKFVSEDSEDTNKDHVFPLNIKYDWSTKTASAYWDSDGKSPELKIEMHGFSGIVPAFPSRKWTDLDAQTSEELGNKLKITSILTVKSEDEKQTGQILIIETFMTSKPSMLKDLTPQQIFNYWSLLTPEEKVLFIEKRAVFSGLTEKQMKEVLPIHEEPMETVFDKFAGIFHAFKCMEENVIDSLSEHNYRSARARLFGNKHDSMPYLLSRLDQEDATCDSLTDYVTLLCAKQIYDFIHKEHQQFFKENRSDYDSIEKWLKRIEVLRQRLVEKGDKDMPAFMDWFDSWFLKRAEPLEESE